MPILGHGIDLVETARLGHLVEAHGARFLDRCFTPAEQAYARERARWVEHLAGRFAAKEAILKALGTGWSRGIAWTDAEVARAPGGRPIVRLHGAARARARAMGIESWVLSITHVRDHAMASAIGEGARAPGRGAEEAS